MGNELEVANAVAEVEPAVQAFAEATGLLGPVREVTAWITDLIRHRRAPYQARLLMRAAEKIKESGMPPAAVEDKMLRAVLESGALEDDEAMQEVWANLLANAATEGSASVRASFTSILSDLEPDDARLLDRIFDEAHSGGGARWAEKYVGTDALGQQLGLRDDRSLAVALDNLARLRLCLPQRTNTGDSLRQVTLTPLGRVFVLACRPPGVRR